MFIFLVGNVCNRLLQLNAPLARGLTCLQNTSKMLGFKKSMVYKTPPGGGGGGGEVNHIWLMA